MAGIFSKPKKEEIEMPEPEPTPAPPALAESGVAGETTEKTKGVSKRKTVIAGQLVPTNILKRKILG